MSKLNKYKVLFVCLLVGLMSLAIYAYYFWLPMRQEESDIGYRVRLAAKELYRLCEDAEDYAGGAKGGGGKVTSLTNAWHRATGDAQPLRDVVLKGDSASVLCLRRSETYGWIERVVVAIPDESESGLAYLAMAKYRDKVGGPFLFAFGPHEPDKVFVWRGFDDGEFIELMDTVKTWSWSGPFSTHHGQWTEYYPVVNGKLGSLTPCGQEN